MLEALEDRCAPTGAGLAAFQAVAPQVQGAVAGAFLLVQQQLGAFIAMEAASATTLGPRGIAAAVIPLEQLSALYAVLPQLGLDISNDLVGLMESQLSQMP